MSAYQIIDIFMKVLPFVIFIPLFVILIRGEDKKGKFSKKQRVMLVVLIVVVVFSITYEVLKYFS